jgi:MOSC domain-containing protein YiiM
MTKPQYLTAVYRGKQQYYGIETAMHKSSVEGTLYLSLNGLAGDQCADLRHHGGLDRALHQYPLEHYAYWRKTFPVDNDWQASGMGENLSSEGMTEDPIFLGDSYQWGEAIIEVSQPRSPCFKLNKRWGIDSLSVDMQKNSRCGWLYRVIQPGMVSVHQPLKLIARSSTAITIREVCDVFFGDPLNNKKLLQLKQQSSLSASSLSASLMNKVVKRLESNQVENWHYRLLGPS